MNEYVATIGMFDGVHRGHQFVLQQVVSTARERGMQSMAVTFDRQQSLLMPLSEKVRQIQAAGITQVEVLPFTDEIKQMTARQFMQQVLRDRLNDKVLLTGYDNRFGHNREEGYDDYVRYGRELGIEVLRLPAEGTVSSSLIRQQLQQGQVAEAAALLGYPYTIDGTVAHGEHVGTTMGFPTANLLPSCQQQLIPAPGAYAVTVRVDDDTEVKHTKMNIGRRPTFGDHQMTLEVHVFHFSDDLYGRHLSVSFIARLRDERRFDDIEALKQQLHQDMQQAEEILNSR